jgi:hypothetical protein
MSHVFHQLYFRFTWATHSREPLVDRAWRPQLLEIINEEVKTRGGFPIRGLSHDESLLKEANIVIES